MYLNCRQPLKKLCNYESIIKHTSSDCCKHFNLKQSQLKASVKFKKAVKIICIPMLLYCQMANNIRAKFVKPRYTQLSPKLFIPLHFKQKNYKIEQLHSQLYRRSYQHFTDLLSIPLATYICFGLLLTSLSKKKVH